MNPRTAIRVTLSLAIGLPLLQSLLYWVGGLLAAMGDQAAAGVLAHIQTIAGVLWLLSLAGLVILLAAKSLDDDDGPAA